MTMSYRTLNQIFYTNNKFDDPKMLLLLEPYFMNLVKDLPIDLEQDMANTLIPTTSIVTPSSNEPEKPRKMTGFIPSGTKDRDAIFWCIFAHHHGEMEYEMIRTNYGKRKVDEKMAIYAWLKENRPITKQYPSMKITNGMYQEMLSELMCVQSNTGFLSLIAFSLYYKMNIYLVDEAKKIYLEFLGQAEAEVNPCILYRLERGYRLSYDSSMDTINKLFRLENYQKPLKAISNWKMCELEEVVKQIGLWTDVVSSMKKPELYIHLMEHCQWITK